MMTLAISITSISSISSSSHHTYSARPHLRILVRDVDVDRKVSLNMTCGAHRTNAAAEVAAAAAAASSYDGDELLIPPRQPDYQWARMTERKQKDGVNDYARSSAPLTPMMNDK